MIMSFFTFRLSCSQLFAKDGFTGLSSVWRLHTCNSYRVRALQHRSFKVFNFHISEIAADVKVLKR